MPQHRFFSRQNGYPGGMPVKYFHSDLINDENNESKQFIDKNGYEIINKLDSIKNLSLKNKIKEIAEIYPCWYYYPKDTVITDIRIYT